MPDNVPPDPTVFDPARDGADGALEREWLETDGLGGFSSGTVAMAGTRCYHALLNPAVRPPLGRMVLWASVDERVRLQVGGDDLWLSAHHFPGTVHPQGHRHLARFSARPFPRWTYEINGAQLVRELFLVHGAGDLFVAYTWHGIEAIELGVRPFLAFRDHHDTAGHTEDTRAEQVAKHCWAFRMRGDRPVLHIESPTARFAQFPVWIENVIYPIETFRGLPDREDLWMPGEFTFTLDPGRTMWLRAGLGTAGAEYYEPLRARELRRRSDLRPDGLDDYPGLESLGAAADQFLVRRSGKNTVIAGYPWFTDWGRDTMIALPGLTLAAGRPELARELILTFAEHMRDGLIPNRFPDRGEEPEYNTVDATLWLAVAVHRAWEETGDRTLVQDVLPALREARQWHEAGTRHGIHVDGDGLLASGEEGVQLTWMDAKVEDWVVTPRHGKPVEIQALWYNFLRVGGELEEPADAPPWLEAAGRARDAFAAFWSDERGYLADVLNPDGSVDWSLRPNQLFALSLPFPLVTEDQALSVLRHLREKLLTPRGLRSLSPDHPDYHPRYGGDRRTRDGAYHQGTVWGWLHGPYMSALLRFGGAAGRDEARALLAGWAEHLGEGCLGQAAEVFDAEPPFRPRGCPAQAWTVAELLRVAREVGALSPVDS